MSNWIRDYFTEEVKEPQNREPALIIVGVIIGAVAGFIGGIARDFLYPYGELSFGFRDVFYLFCPFYFVFAGMVSALIVYFLLRFIDKDRQVPFAAKLFLYAIIGFIAGFLIISDWYMPP